MGVTLTGNAPGPGTPTPLFDHEIFGVRHSRYVPYAVTKDGQRFLIARPMSAVAPTQTRVVVVLNWTEGTKPMTRTPGTRLGQSEMLSAIGAGGMDEL